MLIGIFLSLLWFTVKCLRTRSAPSGMPFYPMDAFGRLSRRNRRRSPDCKPFRASPRHTCRHHRTAHAEAAWRGARSTPRLPRVSFRSAFFVPAREAFISITEYVLSPLVHGHMPYAGVEPVVKAGSVAPFPALMPPRSYTGVRAFARIETAPLGRLSGNRRGRASRTRPRGPLGRPSGRRPPERFRGSSCMSRLRQRRKVARKPMPVADSRSF